MRADRSRGEPLPSWVLFVILLGLSLSTHGYHTRDNDQAYRLPLLLHRQNPALFANDPFVRAFDQFNPHVGYLTMIDGVSRVVGLSAALALLYLASYAIACSGLNRLAQTLWDRGGTRVGVLCVGLLLLAKAGNIGTNHLFEPLLLDRGIAFALGWVALAALIAGSKSGDVTMALATGAAALVHPSVGLQLAMLLASSRLIGSLLARWTGWGWRQSVLAVCGLALAIAPGLWLNAGQGGRLLDGMPADEFRILSAFVQSPQHMIPHLWRTPQWLAWACYPALATLALASAPGWTRARIRLALVIAVNLVALGVAWVAIEALADLRVTLFQPFRMATVLRGLCLAALAGRLRWLWQEGGWLGRLRVALLAVGLTGDWALVVATCFELMCSVASPRIPARSASLMAWELPSGASELSISLRALTRNAFALASLGVGLIFLARHDTERGHLRLLAGFGLWIGSEVWAAFRQGRFGNAAGEPIDPSAARRGIAFGSAPGTRHGGFSSEIHPTNRPSASDRLPVVERSDPAVAVADPGYSRPRFLLTRVAGPEHRDAPATEEESICHRLRTRRLVLAMIAAWLLPLVALLAQLSLSEHSRPAGKLAQSLVKRCRFVEIPTDDIERLALWCRSHTPPDARFIGPPQPKTFRLWSQRNLAFNRAGSPYHAAGLTDWFHRFRDHVDFQGSAAEFSRAYLANRQELENRYQKLNGSELAELAMRQQAQYVIAAAPQHGRDAERQDRRSHAERGNERVEASSLTLLHVEGRYAVYRVDVNRCLAPDNR